ESVLDAVPLVQATFTDETPNKAPAGGFVVFYKTVPETVPTGNVLFLDPQDSHSLFSLGPPIETAIVAKQDEESPLLNHVSLKNVMLSGVRPIEWNLNGQSLASESLIEIDGEASVAISQTLPTGQIVVLATQLANSDLPLRLAFPVFMSNVVNKFSSADPTESEFIATSEEPSNDPKTIANEEIAPTNNSLANTTRLEESLDQPKATSLLSEEETDLRPRQRDLAMQAMPEVALASPPVWRPLIWIGFALILGEWLLFQRRIVA
ncbi:MAG: hypothetical protein AAF664_15665, partial [Planctomycetota bacterium]